MNQHVIDYKNHLQVIIFQKELWKMRLERGLLN